MSKETCHECSKSGDLLCCDDEDCSKLFHLKCASLSAVPDDDWFCNYCSPSSGTAASSHHVNGHTFQPQTDAVDQDAKKGSGTGEGEEQADSDFSSHASDEAEDDVEADWKAQIDSYHEPQRISVSTPTTTILSPESSPHVTENRPQIFVSQSPRYVPVIPENHFSARSDSSDDGGHLSPHTAYSPDDILRAKQRSKLPKKRGSLSLRRRSLSTKRNSLSSSRKSKHSKTLSLSLTFRKRRNSKSRSKRKGISTSQTVPLVWDSDSDDADKLLEERPESDDSYECLDRLERSESKFGAQSDPAKLLDGESPEEKQIADIEALFVPTSKVKLQKKGRRFIRGGDLTRVTRRGPKPYVFHLFNDALLYSERTPLGLKLHRELDLRYVIVTDLADHQVGRGNKLKYAFALKSAVKSFVVCAPSQDLKELWVMDITRCVAPYMPEAADEDGNEDTTAPIWVSDGVSNVCQFCKITFTMLNRRHHCRKCGALVCSKCSPNKEMLSNIATKKPVRVCTECSIGNNL